MATGITVQTTTTDNSVELQLSTMSGVERCLTLKLEKRGDGSAITVVCEDVDVTVSLPGTEDIAALLRAALLVFLPGRHLIKSN